jgi:hypothetical protein
MIENSGWGASVQHQIRELDNLIDVFVNNEREKEI